jgi:cellulose synthase/poly-beta-1,6-N-acetylglucosamine synthase-like glycosyltransferase
VIALWVALAALALLLYTYAGYPIVIALLAKLRPARRGAAEGRDWEPLVTVLLPVSNSSAFVEAKIASIQALDWPKDKLQILVYSDGSTDDTVARLERLAAADPRLHTVVATQRSGKPTALNALLPHARGEVLLMTDARQPIAAGALRALVRVLADRRVGCAAGNMILRGATGAGAYWKYEKWIRENEARFRSMVGVSGALYALRREDFAPLPPALFLDDMWVPMRLRLEGRDIVFVPEAEFFDEAFDDDKEFRRKVRTLAGNYQLMALMPRLLVPFANPSWLEFFSHKLLRLVCPIGMLVLAAATAVGLATRGLHTADPESLVFAVLAAGQLGFYGLAVVGPALPGPAKKLGGLARTFVVLNAAALVGFWRWLTGGQAVTW